MSFYAFFKRWLLPSLLPNNTFKKHSYELIILEYFILQSRLFPSRLLTFALKVCFIGLKKTIRRFFSRTSSKKITQPIFLIPYNLYVNRFRRKPAITKFDKPFTPNYNLSQTFATVTGSVL